MKTDEYTDPQAFLAALNGSKRRASKRAAAARPRAGQAARTGLSTFLLAGWNYTWQPSHGYRLDNRDGRTSGWQPSEKAACDAARRVT